MSKFALKYQAEWGSRQGLYGHLYIDEAYYSGAVINLKLSKSGNSLQIVQHWNDWDSYILGKTLSFEIINNFSDFYTLLPLMTDIGVIHRVRLDIEGPSGMERNIFTGYIDQVPTTQKMVKNSIIHLTASTQLSNLQNWTIGLVNQKQDIRFINLIDAILSEIDSYNIRVNCSLSDGSVTAGHTLFDVNGINTELFWQDNVKRKYNDEILKEILQSFNCYLYWKEGYWYIEQFDDLWKDTVSYIEYTTGVIYDGQIKGVEVTITRNQIDLHQFVFLRQSQTLRMNKAVSNIRINVDTANHLFLNLIDPKFNVDNIPDVSSSGVPIPNIREWVKDGSFTWLNYPSFNNITNTIWKNNVGCNGDKDFYSRGLWTAFKIFVNDENTTISITWKYAPLTGTNDSQWSSDFLKQHSFDFHWSLRQYWNSYMYFIKNQSSGEYELVEVDAGSPVYNTEHVEGKDFDLKNGTYTLNINVGIGKAGSAVVGTIQDLVFGIGITEVYDSNKVPLVPGALGTFYSELYGDVLVTANQPVKNIDNHFNALINSSVHNVKKYDLTVVDVSNINYSNGILTGSYLQNRTTQWTNGSSIFRDIVTWFIFAKFRLYYQPRQKITADVIVPKNMIQKIEVFDRWVDSKQNNKKFLLTGYNHYPLMDEYSIILEEYDADTDVYLIESGS